MGVGSILGLVLVFSIPQRAAREQGGGICSVCLVWVRQLEDGSPNYSG